MEIEITLGYRSIGILKVYERKFIKQKKKDGGGTEKVKVAAKWQMRGYLSFPCLQVRDKGKVAFRGDRWNIFSQG